MIRSFRSAETNLIWQGIRSRKLPPDIQSVALRKLMMLHRARTLNDLRVPPANRLEALKGKRAGQWSIPDQSPVADLLSLAGRRCERCRDCRLPQRIKAGCCRW
jgi:proteic killer suppression protein